MVDTFNILTVGGWHPKAVLQIKKLARAQARTTGKDEDEAIRHLFQRLAVLLVKGNATLLVNRIPSHPLPSVNGELWDCYQIHIFLSI